MKKTQFSSNENLKTAQLKQIKGGSDAPFLEEDVVLEKGTPVSGSTSIAKPTSV